MSVIVRLLAAVALVRPSIHTCSSGCRYNVGGQKPSVWGAPALGLRWAETIPQQLPPPQPAKQGNNLEKATPPSPRTNFFLVRVNFIRTVNRHSSRAT